MSKVSPLAKFLKPIKVCENCGVQTSKTLCSSCESRRDEVVIHRRKEVDSVYAETKAIWQGCDKCAGGREAALRCKTTSCRELYRRITMNRKTHASVKKLAAIDPKAMDVSLDDIPELF